MNSRIENVLPAEIERRSFEIITQELAQMGKVLRPELYLGIWCIVLGLSVALINLWIARRGAAIFENL